MRVNELHRLLERHGACSGGSYALGTELLDSGCPTISRWPEGETWHDGKPGREDAATFDRCRSYEMRPVGLHSVSVLMTVFDGEPMDGQPTRVRCTYEFALQKIPSDSQLESRISNWLDYLAERAVNREDEEVRRGRIVAARESMLREASEI